MGSYNNKIRWETEEVLPASASKCNGNLPIQKIATRLMHFIMLRVLKNVQKLSKQTLESLPYLKSKGAPCLSMRQRWICGSMICHQSKELPLRKPLRVLN